MAFAIRNLTVHAYSNGATLWHYKSKDALDTISAGNYFADACDMLAVGDLVIASTTNGARILFIAEADLDHVITAPLS